MKKMPYVDPGLDMRRAFPLWQDNIINYEYWPTRSFKLIHVGPSSLTSPRLKDLPAESGMNHFEILRAIFYSITVV